MYNTIKKRWLAYNKISDVVNKFITSKYLENNKKDKFLKDICSFRMKYVKYYLIQVERISGKNIKL
jgi:hypothetical protein